MDSIYRPGLVYSNKPNEKRYYLRDSADGVAIMRRTGGEGDEDEDDFLFPVPVECKCRANERTYQRERNNITALQSKTDYLERYADIDEIFFAEIHAFKTTPNGATQINPALRKAIPDAHELIQLLHHVATYGTQVVYFLVGGHSRLMAIYEVFGF